MQKAILSQKNRIAIMSGSLIVLGFFARLVLGNEWLFTLAFMLASILGVAPIAIQAYQALKVKVVSSG
ncbi:hypothetical protein [Fundicoccus ignavus]|uniref:Uncharacterized protein n=1 Tax=Fundicoccus ignavus TaxID=2664442 RepID=A0A844C0Z4_9LACT|nr:hypothetical protein [Fundicoccus ignavus]MRJ46812.1 hypothetical protein [Fundicoccus ignavus]